MELKNTNKDYQHWLEQVKLRIRTARVKVSLAANAELITFYWDLGKMMSEISVSSEWGNNWLGQLSNDLRKDFPDVEGFSKTNLYNIRRLYNFYAQDEFFHQAGGKIHH